jgi:hypothetical protein
MKSNSESQTMPGPEDKITTQPRVTKEQAIKWCPNTRPGGEQPAGRHAEIPPMEDENANAFSAKYQENRDLNKALHEKFKELKATSDKFVLQWRMFPKDTGQPDEGGCACGCSCSCG